MISPGQGQRDTPSTWFRAPRDPNLMSAIFLVAIVSIVIDIVAGRLLKLPSFIVYPAIIIINAAIIAVFVFKSLATNKQAEKARREAYRQKFEGNLEAIKAWSERRISRVKQAASPLHNGERGLTYEDAGVSIDTKMSALDKVKNIMRSTYRPEVLSDMGCFGGLFALDKSKYSNPVLVSSNDSVGTKLKIAFMTGRHNTVGFDIVTHCGNDIVVLGAEPLFFLDYISTSKVEPDVMVQLMEGLAAGCRTVGCALVGGETAELPSFYQPGEYDLAGTIVGVAERHKVIKGDRIEPGDRIIGMASVGLHTNGYSLARKILFEVCGYGVGDFVQELGTKVGDELLKPHRGYVKPILNLIGKFNAADFNVKGLAHITGGGTLDNIPRILPENCNAVIEKGTWNIPAIFTFLQNKGNVAENEMYRVFNMGIGMVLVVSADHADRIMEELKASGETVYQIGRIAEGNKKVVLA